jgi:Flp pilus assembly protein CpaB
MPRPIAPPTLVRLRILVWHARPALGVVALLIACATVVRLVAPPPPPTVPTVVAARDVAAGSELTAADLRIVAVPRPLVPDGAGPGGRAAEAALTDLVGRRVAVDVPRGLAVVESLLEGARFGVPPPAGTVVVPVRLDAAAVARLLRPGDLVDLVAPQGLGWADAVADAAVRAGSGEGEGSTATVGTQPQVLARRALVLDVGEGSDDREPGAGLTGLTAPDADPVALVAVTPEEGRLLAAAAARDVLGAVLVE